MYDLLSDSLYGVPDTSLTAFSQNDDCTASHSRLGNDGWRASLEAEGEWIQVDLEAAYLVNAIYTQGIWYEV